MRAKRMLLSLILLCYICSCFLSCGEKTKDVSYCELGMFLPSDFEEYDSEGVFDLALKSEDVVVGFIRLSFDAAIDDGIPATLSPLKFATEYRKLTGKQDVATEAKEHGDVAYFTYSSESDGEAIVYLPTFYKSFYAYFVVTFIGKGMSEEELASRCLPYTESAYLEYPKQ